MYCHALMNWLEEEKIDFQEIDARSVPDITAVPVTVITDQNDKNPVQVIGFDRDAILEAIKKVKPEK